MIRVGDASQVPKKNPPLKSTSGMEGPDGDTKRSRSDPGEVPEKHVIRTVVCGTRPTGRNDGVGKAVRRKKERLVQKGE